MAFMTTAIKTRKTILKYLSKIIIMSNVAIIDDRKTEVSFQGQQIKTGSFLYSFVSCSVIQVLSIVDCGDEVCIAYDLKGSELVESLGQNFCSVPTLKEAEEATERNDFARKTGNSYQSFELFKGATTKKPSIDDLLTTGERLSVVRFASIINPESEVDTFTAENRFLICKSKNGSARTENVVGLGSFLYVFFTDRLKEWINNK